MHAFRLSRLTTAFIALLSILFMQLAVASYACPSVTVPVTGSIGLAAAAAESAEWANQAMPGCVDMDRDQPSLCHAHEQAGTQSLDRPDLPQVQPFMAAGLSVLLLTDALVIPASAVFEEITLTRATAPPLSIQNCCFRI